MAQTRVKIGFRTRYKITAIDSETGHPVADPIAVCNIVLDRGILALGDAVSYSMIALGTSSIPADSTQTGLINAVSTLPLETGTFEQTNYVQGDGGVGASVIARTFLFKEFTFSSNIRTLDLNEIGLVGRTRAVFDTLTIDRKTWVKVDLEIVYEYASATASQIPNQINAEEEGIITYDITPIIFNSSPANDSGKGYGQVGALRSYIYDGINPISSSASNGLGLTITGTLHYEDLYYSFHYASERFQDDTPIHGFVIRDTNNGIGFLIEYHQPYIVEEDDSLDITVEFYWGQSSSANE